MNKLWPRIRNTKSSSQSLQDRKATQNKLVLLGKPVKRFNLADVMRARKQGLGKGMFGTTNKADLKDGTITVVVKMLEDVVLSAEDFQDKVEALGAMDHENLLPLRGYFYSKDQKFLLCDYMPLGSLSDQLHGNRELTPLGWELRLLIALGAARAIEHLHAQCHPYIHHGNIKSSNILLTPSYEARLTHYGLAPLTGPASEGSNDPTMTDVNSFGVLLLELLTGKPLTQALLKEEGHGVDLPTWIQSIPRVDWTVDVFDLELMLYPDLEEGMVELLEVAMSCVSPNPHERPQMSGVRRKIEELSGLVPSAQVDRDSQLNLFREVNNDLYTWEPPDGILKVSERVYVFDCCLTVDGLNNEGHQIWIERVAVKVGQHFPDAFFKVFNFGEQENQSHLSVVLSHMPVMYYPIHHGDCPILTMEMIQLFLRSADAWLSCEEQRCMLLMHCERGGWPVLAFMLAALLLYWKKSNGEEETLHLIYKKAPPNILHLISPLNPLPSQLRYLHYISTSNVDSKGRLPDKAVTLDSVILRFVPYLDAEVGCHLMFKIFGQDPHNLTDKTPTVLFSTPERGKDIKHYKQITFSEMNPAASLVSIDSTSDEEPKENQLAKGAKKIEAQELQVEDQTVYSASLSRDANTSHDDNEVREWPIQSNTAFPTSILEPKLSSQLEASVHSALDGSLASSDSASSSLSQDGSLVSFSATLTEKNIESLQSHKQHLVSSLELPQDVHSGENMESVRWEGIAAVTGTNMEVTLVGDLASSSAINNGSVEANAAGVSNLVQIPDLTLPKQEKVYQQDDSPSSTSMSSGYDYDVFLSFRGPDTRSGITSFLYTRLQGAKINTFKDDEELRVGEEFGPELLKAISQSKIAIPIFSTGYASSKWCLNELVQMVECSKTRRQKIMPIFYNITPAEVRHQTGSYEEAFLLHKEKFGANVSKWKAALNHVANLNGWDNSKKNRGEGELVDEIVKKVIDELKTAYLLVTDYLVEVENHVKEIDAMMCVDSEDIRILGIHGMGGVGKTTLAKIIYNRLLHHFEACCFLSNIRGTSELKGIEGLQNQLISDVLKKEWSNISNVED